MLFSIKIGARIRNKDAAPIRFGINKIYDSKIEYMTKVNKINKEVITYLFFLFKYRRIAK